MDHCHWINVMMTMSISMIVDPKFNAEMEMNMIGFMSLYDSRMHFYVM
jgi:hypothetical protein